MTAETKIELISLEEDLRIFSMAHPKAKATVTFDVDLPYEDLDKIAREQGKEVYKPDEFVPRYWINVPVTSNAKICLQSKKYEERKYFSPVKNE